MWKKFVWVGVISITVLVGGLTLGKRSAYGMTLGWRVAHSEDSSLGYMLLVCIRESRFRSLTVVLQRRESGFWRSQKIVMIGKLGNMRLLLAI